MPSRFKTIRRNTYRKNAMTGVIYTVDYTEIVISTDVKNLDAAEAIANMTVPYGIYIEDYSNLEDDVHTIAHIDLIDEELLLKDRSKGLIHIYIDPEQNPGEAVSFLRERLSLSGIDYEIDCKVCKESDWANNWRKYYKPIKIGKRLLVCPAWIKDENEDNRKVLLLEPGMAFGTGAHETTRLCLSLADRFVKGNEEVLDVGCGSGILSVAALILGAGHADAVDIDPLAVKTADENAYDNGVSERFCAVCGDLTDKISGKYDIVFANIVADAIIRLNVNISGFMKKGARYIMSGIIDTREDEVIASLPECFEVLCIERENGWSAVCAEYKG